MKIQIEIREELFKEIITESYKEEMPIDDTIQLMLLMYLSPLTKHDETDYRITKKVVEMCSKRKKKEEIK